MSDEELSFLGAIKEADVDEDTPRLAYADWLDEQGDRPHFGEAIRLDIAVRNEEKVLKEYRTIASMRNSLRVHELLTQYAPYWFGLGQMEADEANKYQEKMRTVDAPLRFDRGLLVLTGPIDLMYNAGRLFPWVDGARVTGPRGGAYKLMKLMAKTRLRRLAFHAADQQAMFDVMGRFCRAVTREFEVHNLKHVDFGYSCDAAVIREVARWDLALVLRELKCIEYGPRPYVGHGDEYFDAAIKLLVEKLKHHGLPDLLKYNASTKPRF
jgi:uncharacterized protein (TIGR02996 family)